LKPYKTPLLIAGVLLLLAGLLFIGQGTGYFPYPRSSFMISERPWAYRGAGLAVTGVAAILLGRKL